MTKYVVDSSAWVEYFTGSEKGAKIRVIIEQPGCELFSPSSVVAEVVSRLNRLGFDDSSEIHSIFNLSKVVAIDGSIAIDIGRLHAKTRKTVAKFSFTDSSIAIIAGINKAKILTCDFDFKGFKNAIII